MKRNRRLFYVVLGVFVCLCVFWIFHFPYNPARLYAAVPPGTTFITLHEDLDDHWKDFAQNPITTNVLYRAGIDAAAQAGARQHPGLQRALRYLAGRECIVAHVPHLGDARRPAWIGASWVGGFGNVLRMWLSLRPPAGLQRLSVGGHASVWVLDRHVQGATERLSFAIVDGVLLACYSTDPTAVRTLIARVDFAATPSPELVAHLERERERGRFPHRLWLHWYRRQGKAHRLIRTASEFSFHGRDASRGKLKIDIRLPPAETEPPSPSEAASVFGEDPCAVASLPLAHLDPWLGTLATNQLVGAIREIMQSCGHAQPQLVAAMYGGELSGRLMDIRVPAVIIGTRARASVNTPAIMAQAIDRLNAERRWALLVRRQVQDGIPLMVIDGTRGDLFSLINNEEKPAFAMKNGWLLFGSNLQTLATICRGTPAPDALRPAWVEAFASHDTPLAFWADLGGSAETIKHGIAVYWLIQRVSETPGNERTNQGVNALGDWTAALRPLAQCSMWGSGEKDGFELSFELGEQPE